MIRSTHIILEPNTQAKVVSDNRPRLLYEAVLPIPLTQVMIHPLVSLSSPIFAGLSAATRRLGTFRGAADEREFFFRDNRYCEEMIGR